MSTGHEHNWRERLNRAPGALRSRFSLREDRADDAAIDGTLRAGVVMQGTNLWLLMFAIFIASIGLNVNSTAVVIGAMLISPLMGPIMGVGYGAGILDVALIQKALKNLGIATLLALLTSTAYFLVTPLTTVQSELLARTTPSIWDVLIAVFGGLAGIVGATRRERSNVIPGVAIATALMPPLCTAGFGLANGAWNFFFGAFYLFAINCVFIAASSALVVSAFHVRRKQFADQKTESRVRLYLGIVVLVTLLPSLYLAYRLVGEEVFRTRATQFVNEQLEFARTHVNNINVDAKARRIQVSLIGEVVPQSTLVEVVGRLPGAGLKDAKLQVFQTGDQRIDVATLKSTLLGDLYKDSQAALAERDQTVQQLRSELAAFKSTSARFQDIPAELHALYPQISHMLLSEGPGWDAGKGLSDQSTLILNVRTSKPLTRNDRDRIEQWLLTRTKAVTVHLVVETDSRNPPR